MFIPIFRLSVLLTQQITQDRLHSRFSWFGGASPGHTPYNLPSSRSSVNGYCRESA